MKKLNGHLENLNNLNHFLPNHTVINKLAQDSFWCKKKIPILYFFSSTKSSQHQGVTLISFFLSYDFMLQSHKEGSLLIEPRIKEKEQTRLINLQKSYI